MSTISNLVFLDNQNCCILLIRNVVIFPIYKKMQQDEDLCNNNLGHDSFLHVDDGCGSNNKKYNRQFR